MPAVTSTLAKRVHFAEDIVHPPPRTPSPTWSERSASSSSSSSAESSGPSTPPMIPAMLVPAPGTPSTPESYVDESKPAQIHGALAFRPDVPCMLAHDISVHPSRMHPPSSMSPDAFAELLAQPATHPPLPSMMLVSGELPQPIVVHPAGADRSGSNTSPHTPSALFSPSLAPPAFVTVHDVLTALYTSLRTPLSPEEYNGLPQDHQRDVARAYGMRVNRVSERKREAERAKGVKRVDLVLANGTPTFNGLGATKRSRSLWVLNLRM